MALSLIPSSSSSNTPQFKYDVFISFRGKDACCKFIRHLDKALRDKHIMTFIDHEPAKPAKGVHISPSLLDAIEVSQIYVIVFSREYASSKWCLEELVKILECREKNVQMVIPVFYGVDPSDVRHQTGSFAKAFAEHEQLFKENKVKRWKDALKETANLAGWDSSTFRLESLLIEAIVQDVLKKMDRLSSPDTSHLVGIDSRIKEIESLLSIGTNDVCSVGIWGMGGIGKTSLAESVFNKISHQFEGSYFCRNVRERCQQNYGLHHLQQDLLSSLLGGGNENIVGIFNLVRSFVKNRLGHMKLLIVFDDVSDYKKIEYLIGGFDCLGPHSRIIMTTRDLQVLRNGRVNFVYEVRQLIDLEALKLFSWYAFRRNHPTEDYMVLSERVVKYAGGNPLALKVLGSHLFGKRKEVWLSVIGKLETIPHEEIYKVLKISYDGLDDEEKKIFLYIAIFFKSSHIKHVKAFIEACGFRADGIDVLISRALITMSDYMITMDDLLQAVAREIVRQESIEDPTRHEDIYRILTINSGFRNKKRILAVLFLLLEIISFVLDKIGGSNRVFLLASFLLSAIGFLTTIYTSFCSRTVAALTRSESEKKFIAVEVVFSFIQLVVTCIQLIRTVLGAKSNNNWSLLPLAFAVISVVFTFRNNEEAQLVSDSASVGQIISSTIPAVDKSVLQRVSSMVRKRTTSTQSNQLHNTENLVVARV